MFVLDQTVHGYLDVILSDVSVALRGRGRALLQASCISGIEEAGAEHCCMHPVSVALKRQGQSTAVCILYQWH